MYIQCIVIELSCIYTSALVISFGCLVSIDTVYCIAPNEAQSTVYFLHTMKPFITAHWKGSRWECFGPRGFKSYIRVLNLPKRDQSVDWLKGVEREKKKCPQISQLLKSHMSRTHQTIAVISAVGGWRSKSFPCTSDGLELPSRVEGYGTRLWDTDACIY